RPVSLERLARRPALLRKDRGRVRRPATSTLPVHAPVPVGMLELTVNGQTPGNPFALDSIGGTCLLRGVTHHVRRRDQVFCTSDISQEMFKLQAPQDGRGKPTQCPSGTLTGPPVRGQGPPPIPAGAARRRVPVCHTRERTTRGAGRGWGTRRSRSAGPAC